MGVIDYTERVVVRALRIVCGFVLFGLAWWLVTLIFPIFDRPLSSLTLGDIAKVLFFGWLALIVVSGAFYSAFGPGPSKY